MRKYNIYLLLLVMSLLFSWACKKKEYEPPMAENSHVFLTTNAGDIFLNAIKYDTISLIDLSKGVISRTWRFDLLPPEVEFDIIGSDNDETNSNQVCKVRFFDHGTFTVPVQLKFDENVWVGRNQLQTNVLDTSITFRIADSVHAAFNMGYVLEQDSYEPSDENWDYLELSSVGEKIPIMGGDEMYFVNESSGDGLADFVISRSDIDFSFTRVDVVDTFIYKFSSLGEYNVQLNAHSNFDTDTLYYESLVEVNKSWRPVTIDVLEVVDADDNDGKDQIRLEFSRDIATPNFTDLREAFFVKIDPQFQDPIATTVTAVTQNAQLPYIFYLTVDKELYNTDLVTVTYDSTYNGGVLISADDKIVGGFDSVEVSFPRFNMFEDLDWDYDFESVSVGWYNCNWPAPWNNGSITANAVNVSAYSGSSSIHIVAPPGNAGNTGFAAGSSTTSAWNFYETAMKVDIPSGAFEFGAWFYMNNKGTPSTNATENYNIRFWLFDDTDALVGEGSIIYLYGLPLGQWTYSGTQYSGTISAGSYTFLLRIMNDTNEEEMDFNIDHMEMYEVQVRPSE